MIEAFGEIIYNINFYFKYNKEFQRKSQKKSLDQMWFYSFSISHHKSLLDIKDKNPICLIYLRIKCIVIIVTINTLQLCLVASIRSLIYQICHYFHEAIGAQCHEKDGRQNEKKCGSFRILQRLLLGNFCETKEIQSYKNYQKIERLA